jgi:hypothetical protein
MDALVRSYPNIFPQDRPEAEAEGPAGEDSGSDEDAAQDVPDTFTQRWGWFSLVDTVSETLRCPWDDVWKQTMVETLNIFAYTKDRNARREDQIEQYKRTH